MTSSVIEKDGNLATIQSQAPAQPGLFLSGDAMAQITPQQAGGVNADSQIRPEVKTASGKPVWQLCTANGENPLAMSFIAQDQLFWARIDTDRCTSAPDFSR